MLTSCTKSCHKDACRNKLEVGSKGLAINIFLIYIAKFISNIEHLIHVLQIERNNYRHIWKCGKYRKMEVAVVETSSRVSNFTDKLMYASASLTFFQSTWYGAKSAIFFSDLNLCKCLKSIGHACNTQISTQTVSNCLVLFFHKEEKGMETYIYTICFQLRSVKRCHSL